MIQIKTIEAYKRAEELDKKVNEWLASHQNIDVINVSTSGWFAPVMGDIYMATIVYKEKAK